MKEIATVFLGLGSGAAAGSGLQDIPSYSMSTPRGTGVTVMTRWDSVIMVGGQKNEVAGRLESGAATGSDNRVAGGLANGVAADSGLWTEKGVWRTLRCVGGTEGAGSLELYVEGAVLW